MSNLKIARNTKGKIIAAARRLFSEYTYLGVSMSRIARKLNITKAALYYHFTGKAEIYREILDQAFEELNQKILTATSKAGNAREKLYWMIVSYLDFGQKEKNLVKISMLNLSQAGPSGLKKYILRLRKKIDYLAEPLVKEVLSQEKKKNSKLFTAFLGSAMDSLLLEYAAFNKKINPAKMANQIMAILRVEG